MPDLGFDAWMDAQLRHVPLPADLLPRLRQMGPNASADERLDLALTNVPIPDTLSHQLRAIARQGRPEPLSDLKSLAVLVALALGIALFVYVNRPDAADSPTGSSLEAGPSATAARPANRQPTAERAAGSAKARSRAAGSGVRSVSMPGATARRVEVSDLRAL